MTRTEAGGSFYNPVERIHAVGNLGLPGVGIMRKNMGTDMEHLIKNANSNDEIGKSVRKPGSQKVFSRISKNANRSIA